MEPTTDYHAAALRDLEAVIKFGFAWKALHKDPVRVVYMNYCDAISYAELQAAADRLVANPAA